MEYTVEFETSDISQLHLLLHTTNAEPFGAYPPGAMMIRSWEAAKRDVPLFASVWSTWSVKAVVVPMPFPWLPEAYPRASWNFPADATVTPPLPVDVPVGAA